MVVEHKEKTSHFKAIILFSRKKIQKKRIMRESPKLKLFNYHIQ
jgi:hypothetical protein